MPAAPSSPSKRVSRRLLPWMLATTLLSTGCEAERPDDAVDRLLDQARSEYEAGRHASGIIEAQKAVQRAPNDPDALMMLARLHLAAEDGLQAEQALVRAQSSGAPQDAVATYLAQALVLQGRHDEALALLPEDADSPLAGERLAIRADALFAMGNNAGARALYEKAESAGNRLGAAAGFARLAMTEGRLDEAARIVAEGLALAPGHRSLLILEGEIALGEERWQEAQDRFEDLVARNRRDLRAQIGLGRALLGAGRAEEANRHFQDIERLFPNSLALHRLAAAAAFESGDFARANDILAGILAARRADAEILTLAGATAHALGQREAAIAHLRRALERAPHNGEARRLLGALMAQEGEYEEALGHLRGSIRQNPDDPGLLAFGGLTALRSGDMEEGSRYLERLAEIEPGDLRTRTYLGLARVLSGRTREGIAELRAVIAQGPDLSDGHIALAFALMRERRHDEALDALKPLEAREEDRPTALMLAGIVQMQAGRIEAAREALESAFRIDPRPETGTRLAAILWSQGFLEEAGQVLDTLLERVPKHPVAAWMKGMILMQEGLRSEAVALLDQAVDTLEKARRRDPDDQVALSLMGTARLVAGRHAQAAEDIARLAALNPDSAHLQFTLALLRGLQQDRQGLRAGLQRALRADPDHKAARELLVRLLLEERAFTSAASHLDALRRLAPDLPTLGELDGLLHLGAGRHQEALAAFGRLAAPTSLSQRSVAHALWQIGERKQAAETLSAWLDKSPEDATARLQLANYLTALGRQDAALPLLEHHLEQAPGDVAARNNLAWLLAQKGELAAARTHVEKAFLQDPHNAAVLDTLGYVLLRQGEPKQALEPLQRAASLLPDHPAVQFHFAEALNEAGDSVQALRILDRIVDRHPGSKEQGLAETLAHRIRSGQPEGGTY